MSETVVAPAAPAASTPAPAPVAAPVSTPAAAPVSNPVATRAGVTSQVDPNQGKEAYAQAVLAEQLAAVPATEETPEVAETPVEVPEVAVEPETPVVEVPAPDAEAEKPEEVAEEEPAFELEPAPIVTPEFLTQMVTDNPEFGKLLEADPKLKGQLYKTAREAAELQPYRALFPDLDFAKAALDDSKTWVDVRSTFMNSTTREGTVATLARIAELSYERDENGEVVMQNGQPVYGDDFYSFVDNVAALDFEHALASAGGNPFAVPTVNAAMERSLAEITAKLDKGAYTDQATFDADSQYALAMQIALNRAKGDLPLTEQPQEMTPFQRQKQAELDDRERKQTEGKHQESIQKRDQFDHFMTQEGHNRLAKGTKSIIDNVKKQGAVISPFNEDTLMKSIPALTLAKILANPVLVDQMKELQRLPIGDKSKARRLAAIDRAYQLYLPDVAREQLKAAGVQIKANADAKALKVNDQAEQTRKTEPRGSIGHTSGAKGPLTATAAYDYAQAEWQKANPGRAFDSVARSKILGRVVQLQVHGV